MMLSIDKIGRLFSEETSPRSVIFHSFSRGTRKSAAATAASSVLGIQWRSGDPGIYEAGKNSAGNLTASEIERGLDFLQQTPYGRKANILIIDDAETMTEEAANSLLKLLEEPPESSYCMLLAADQDALLPTIRSRCTYFKLKEPSFHEYRLMMEEFCPSVTDEEAEFFNRCRGLEPNEETLSLFRDMASELSSLILMEPKATDITAFSGKMFGGYGKNREKSLLRYNIFLSLVSVVSFDMILMEKDGCGITLDSMADIYKKLDFDSRFPIIIQEISDLQTVKRYNLNMRNSASAVLFRLFGKERI